MTTQQSSYHSDMISGKNCAYIALFDDSIDLLRFLLNIDHESVKSNTVVFFRYIFYLCKKQTDLRKTRKKLVKYEINPSIETFL